MGLGTFKIIQYFLKILKSATHYTKQLMKLQAKGQRKETKDVSFYGMKILKT
jgi:hypothetical protein